jgi:hypothetical protein
MRKIIVLLGILLVAACADTLDFTRWTVRMTTVLPTAPSADETSIDLTGRGLNMLRFAYFDDMQTVTDYLFANPKVSRKVDKLRQLATQSDTKFLSDGTVAVDYELPLTGAVLQTLMPRTGGGIPVGPMACPVCGQPWPEGREVPPGITLVPLEEGNATNYTGVLIDARGVDFNYALFPRIVNEDGRTVYGPEFFLPNYAADRGSVGYYDNFPGAMADDRVGFNPLRINAIRAAGKNNTDLVIANLDARKLHSSLENLKLLERCRVVILTD